jgi:hypothetical protein
MPQAEAKMYRQNLELRRGRSRELHGEQLFFDGRGRPSFHRLVVLKSNPDVISKSSMKSSLWRDGP